jgi:hypothetical protein
MKDWPVALFAELPTAMILQSGRMASPGADAWWPGRLVNVVVPLS